MTRPRLTWVRPFLVLVLVVTVPPALYWLGYVNSSVDAAIRQFNTTTAAVAESLGARLRAHDTIAANAEELPDGRSRPEYLQSLLANAKATTGSGAHHLAVNENDRGLMLSVCSEGRGAAGRIPPACTGDEELPLTSVSVPLDSLVPWDIVTDEFDGLLVLSRNGHLLAQDPRLPAQARGLPVAVVRGGVAVDFDGVFDPGVAQADATSDAPTEATSSQAARGWRSPLDFSALDAVTIAGTRYVAFVHPLRVYSTPVAAGGAPGAVDMLVVGLVEADRLRDRVISLSPQTLASVISLVLLGVLSIPLLKLRFIGAHERMRFRDVWMMVGAMLALTAVLTLLVLDGAATKTLLARFDSGMIQVHDAIERRANAEAIAAIEQLEAAPGLRVIAEATTTADGVASVCGPPGTVTGIVKGGALLTPEPLIYPAFDTLFLATREGQQILKWTPRTIPTGLVDIRSRRYFQDALAADADTGREGIGREFVVSMTSGLEQMVFAIPFDCAAAAVGTALPPSRRSHVAALVTAMRSLSGTVVPLPYEFVLVNRDGTVAFRNARGPYLGERFLENVEGGAMIAPASVLARAAADHSNDHAAPRDVDYHGRHYRMHATEVAELGMTLVTFYDTEHARRLVARAFGVAALIAFLVVLSALLGSIVAARIWGRASHDWLWPNSAHSWRYVLGAIVCVLSVVTLVLLRHVVGESWFVAFPLTVPAMVAILAGSPLWAKSWLARSSGGGARSMTAHKVAFCTFLVSVPLAMVAAPTVLAFDDALRLFAAAYERGAALEWVAQTDRSDRQFEAEYVKVDDSAGADVAACGVPDRICTRANHYRQLATWQGESSVTAGAGARWNVYHECAALQPATPGVATAGVATPDLATPDLGTPDLAAPDTTHDCRAALDPSNAPWSFTRGLARPLANMGTADPSFAAALEMRDTILEPPAPSRPLAGWMWTGSTWVLIVIAFVLLILTVTSVAVHILGLGWRNRRLLDVEASDLIDAMPGTRWLLVRPTLAFVATLTRRATHTINLRHGVPGAEPVAPAAGEVLVVLDVEAALADEALRTWLLRLAARPVDGSLIFCAEIDPLYYVTQRLREALDSGMVETAGPQAERAAAQVRYDHLQTQRGEWAQILRDVQKLRMEPPEFPAPGARLSRAHLELLKSECRGSDPLIAIGQRLAAAPGLANYREDEIVDFILDAAEPYYRALWERCSQDERLLLVQLAEEGVVNPKRLDLMWRLHRRGLVVVDPRFALMNRSFHAFVLTVESPERIREWEQTSDSVGWKRFSVPLYTLAAVVIAMLLFTQQDLFSQTLAIAAGAAGALNSLRGLGLAANAFGGAADKTARV